ncbi:MAG: cupin domain-containing protein [Candidatus Thorarchaeota archaeon]
MKKVSEKDMTPGSIQGEKGIVDVYDIIQEEVTAGVRVVQPNSDVPIRPHVHHERQVIYVISGSGKITNGKETFDLHSGDFIILSAEEEHYVITESEELKVFEVKYP